MFAAVIALVTVGAVLFSALGIMAWLGRGEAAAKSIVGRRLEGMERMLSAQPAADILRRPAADAGGLAFLEQAVAAMPAAKAADGMLREAGLNWSAGTLVGLSGVLGLSTVALTWAISANILIAMCAGGMVAMLPWLYARQCRARRMLKFQRQLPDALDLITRALKAGHAFSSGMALVASEFEAPLGPEFAKTMEEINFGLPPDKALWNLSERVDCPDLVFFIVSVNIQRETGGNLAEIVGGIATLIRERAKLHGRIRVLSAEGRMSAWVLVGLPFCIAGAVAVLNPDYLRPLITQPVGKVVVAISLGQMLIGILAIRKLIRIKV